MFPRSSGLLLPVSSLPGGHGIGDLGESAYRFADLCSAAGQTWWQVLPLNPTNDECGNSPYFSSSAFAGNPLLIGLDRVVADGLLKPEDLPPPSGGDPHTVAFPAVRQVKLQALDTAYRHFAGSASRSADYEDFCRVHRYWLDDFTLFTALKERFRDAPWTAWPAPFRDRDAAALDQIREELQERLERCRFFQYLFFRQWFALRRYCNSRGVRIIGDIPIYVSHDSADVWANRHLFKLDDQGRSTGVSGVPPDYFSATGQLWNNPVYNWDALRNQGYDWWVRRMKATFERFDIVRIDHIRGLVQFWEIPAGETTAINGSWQDVPVYDFFDTLVREIPGFPVIAEDLGIITDDVRQMMDHYGFPGMKVLLFAFGDDDPRHPYQPHMFDNNCVVYSGTHDNDTLRGWLETEATPLERERVCRYLGFNGSDDDLVRGVMRLAMASVAGVAVLPVQDLLGLGARARMNQPAQTHGNWKWRLTQEEFDRIPADWLAQTTRLFGRETAPTAQ